MYDPSAAYLGAPVFYTPQAYTAIPAQFRFPAAKAHVGGRGLIRTPSVRGEDALRECVISECLQRQLALTYRIKAL